ncbi:transposase [Marilutibacter alkalisoli]|uniref:Transposase n=1 Tax=Marilutibacter alkalisoli TaxID=2591633 RepID=A0A514BSK0_9GAMM|nr:transposase [Lysobacter alkalisoli]QDH70368.1 transposase [Lysobacter alkalisoli]
MARLPRLDFPGIAQHIVQRGNDRQACFADDADHLHYRQELGQAALKHGCDLHAYVLMTNHVHLLVTPHEIGAVSRMMQAIGRRYVGCFNARYRRTGTLWEGRFKSALVDSADYLLTCYRYIELNPVRAGMVAKPADYRWSSHAHNALGAHESRITPHPLYLGLGANAIERQLAYRELFNAELGSNKIDDLRAHTQQQKAWGSDRFRQQIEALTQRSASVRPRGRPKSSDK